MCWIVYYCVLNYGGVFFYVVEFGEGSIIGVDIVFGGNVDGEGVVDEDDVFFVRVFSGEGEIDLGG